MALEGSYHGRTFGALSLTGQEKHRKGFEPLLEEVTFVKQNDVQGLRAAVTDNTCAIVLEPIFGEGGIYECSVEFLRECRVLADQHRAALIFDEIQCGLGRTGTIFAFQSFGVTPDIVAIAKPIAAGLPLGAFIAKEEFATAISPGQHGTTFGGGPLACRIALEFLSIVEEEKLLENVNKVGAYLQVKLKELVSKRNAAIGVRGRGFIQGIQLEIPARPIVDGGLAEGVLFNSTHDTVVRFLPPFLLEEKHVDKGIRVLKKLLREETRCGTVRDSVEAKARSLAAGDRWPALSISESEGAPSLSLRFLEGQGGDFDSLQQPTWLPGKSPNPSE